MEQLPRPLRRAPRRGRLGSAKAYTLIELLVGLAVFGVLSGLASISWWAIVQQSQDEAAKQALATYIAGQQIEWDNRGGFFQVPENLNEIAEGYVYLAGAIPSTDDDEISVDFRNDGTNDIAAAAILGKSGTCFIWRAKDPSSNSSDVKLRWEPETTEMACTGANALDADAGDGEEW